MALAWAEAGHAISAVYEAPRGRGPWHHAGGALTSPPAIMAGLAVVLALTSVALWRRKVRPHDHVPGMLHRVPALAVSIALAQAGFYAAQELLERAGDHAPAAVATHQPLLWIELAVELALAVLGVLFLVGGARVVAAVRRRRRGPAPRALSTFLAWPHTDVRSGVVLVAGRAPRAPPAVAGSRH
jgi:drug/metabolite transporter (DMT)-like permease